MDVAVFLGVNKAHASRILNGTKRQAAMLGVDPSSVAPAYKQPVRPTACPHCDHGNTWVKLEGHMDLLGRLVFACPNCGRIA